MAILETIKRRTTIRQYRNKKIPAAILKKVIEAGIWGPAIHHFQPWRFVIIRNKTFIKKIAFWVEQKLKKNKIPSFVALPTNFTLRNARVLICVYNTKTFSSTMKKFNRKLAKNFELAEVSALSAAVQNMTLVMEELGLGSCWLDMPLFCRKEINALLRQNAELIAVLTVGYPLKKGLRSKRIPLSDSTCFID